MAQLFLQGGNVMEVSNAQAEVIKAELGTPQAPTFYDIGPIKLKTSTILRVVLDGPQIADEKYLKWRDKVQDWNEYREKFRNLSIGEKADLSMHYYRLLWFSYTGGFETEREDEAIKIAEEFFSKNPQRSIMDYREWKKLMPKSSHEQSEYETMRMGMQKGVLRMIERQLGRDLEDINYSQNERF